MCLAIPSQITEIDGHRAKIELAGNVRDADLSLIEEAKVGDWVLVHAGVANEKLTPADADATLRLFGERAAGVGGVGAS